MIGSYREDSADSVCPPKVRAMLASRACRSSVMIGDSLGRNEMQKVLKNVDVSSYKENHSLIFCPLKPKFWSVSFKR